MAKGKNCPDCGYYMFALEELDIPDGKWVKYQCLDQKCKKIVKVFEKIDPLIKKLIKNRSKGKD